MNRAYRLGIWGSRADRRGLAWQTWDFARWMRPDAIVGFEMHDERCPSDWSIWDGMPIEIIDAPNPQRQIHAADVNRFAAQWFRDIDVCFFAETAYTDEVWEIARAAGCRTVVQANPEFARFLREPIAQPDIVWNPSEWMQDAMPAEIVPAPVDRSIFTPRDITQVTTLVHVVGRPALADRAGTASVMRALRRVTQPCRIIIRSQAPVRMSARPSPKVTVEMRVEDPEDRTSIYAEADALIYPRRYGGQSLVLNEAASLGLPILSLNVAPQNTWLPPEALVAASRRAQRRMPGGLVHIYEGHPGQLAERIDRLVGDQDYVARLRDASLQRAEELDWVRWQPIFEDRFARLAR